MSSIGKLSSFFLLNLKFIINLNFILNPKPYLSYLSQRRLKDTKNLVLLPFNTEKDIKES